MTIIIFLIVLLVCVLVHEWGHYIVAKKSGMLVEEFGFGIPPRLFSWKRGETRYSINALPIGGFVKIAGENGTDESVPLERQFDTKPWHVKSAVLVAGVICNALLAIILFTAAYSIGLPAITENGTPTITTISDNAPAGKAGIAVGDTVQSIQVRGVALTALDTESVHQAIVRDGGPVVITYTHKEEVHTAILEPIGGIIGLGVERIGTVRESLPDAFMTALTQSWQLIRMIFSTLAALIGGLFDGGASSLGLMGPVGLAKEVGHAATFGIVYLLAFTATISINLAVLNIMPFPALDGGRLIIVWGEALTRRKFSKTTVGIIHTVGFLALLALMIFLTVGDIRKTF